MRTVLDAFQKTGIFSETYEIWKMNWNISDAQLVVLAASVMDTAANNMVANNKLNRVG